MNRLPRVEPNMANTRQYLGWMNKLPPPEVLLVPTDDFWPGYSCNVCFMPPAEEEDEERWIRGQVGIMPVAFCAICWNGVVEAFELYELTGSLTEVDEDE